MEYSIVELTPDDWQRYKEIRLEALEYDPQAFGSSSERESRFDEQKWRERLQPYSEKCRQWAVFAEDSEGRLVGSVGAYVPEDGIAEIVGLYVTGEARGYGIGKVLLGEIIEKVKAAGIVERIRLSVNEEQESAVKLYEKAGFVEIEKKDEVLGDGVTHTGLIMEMVL